MEPLRGAILSTPETEKNIHRKEYDVLMKIKTSLYIDRTAWREIKKAAIDAGQTMGEFITGIFAKWRADRDNRKPTD